MGGTSDSLSGIQIPKRGPNLFGNLIQDLRLVDDEVVIQFGLLMKSDLITRSWSSWEPHSRSRSSLGGAHLPFCGHLLICFSPFGPASVSLLQLLCFCLWRSFLAAYLRTSTFFDNSNGRVACLRASILPWGLFSFLPPGWCCCQNSQQAKKTTGPRRPPPENTWIPNPISLLKPWFFFVEQPEGRWESRKREFLCLLQAFAECKTCEGVF